MQEKYISKTLTENQATSDVWESTMTTWRARLKDPDLKDKDIVPLAKEIVGDLPLDPLSQRIKDLGAQKKQGVMDRLFGSPKEPQKPINPNAPGKKQQMTFNPLTGEIQ